MVGDMVGAVIRNLKVNKDKVGGIVRPHGKETVDKIVSLKKIEQRKAIKYVRDKLTTNDFGKSKYQKNDTCVTIVLIS